MKNNASLRILLFRSKTLKNGEHPIMIRVIKDRKSKYISTGYSSKPEHWNFETEEPNKKHANRLEILALIRKKESEISKELLQLSIEETDYSAETVIQKIRKTPTRKVFVFSFFDEIINELKKAQKPRNANVYKQCKNVFYNFCNNDKLQFSDINYHFLKNFETDCLSRGCKEITIAFYMRTLRAVFNRAIKQGAIKPDKYPFKDYSVKKLNTTTRKRAILDSDIEKIEQLQLEYNTPIWHAKSIFLFSYYTMGTNLVDLARLTWNDVKNDRIQYVRAKTKKPYNIVLIDSAKAILKQYLKLKTDKYVFPILNEEKHITEQSKLNRMQKCTSQINSDLKEIATLCGINEKLTTYVARHSAATILKRKGISTSIIKDLLGHQTEVVTQVYLDSFENSVLDSAVNLLSK